VDEATAAYEDAIPKLMSGERVLREAG
jgi:hypothetical protein